MVMVNIGSAHKAVSNGLLVNIFVSILEIEIKVSL